MVEGKKGDTKECNMNKVLIFIAAIGCGTFCSICSKTMMEMKGIGITGKKETFTKPLLQTFGMFVGMIFGIIMHWIVLAFRIEFPGYKFDKKPVKNDKSNNSTKVNDGIQKYGSMNNNERDALLRRSDVDVEKQDKPENHIPLWMYFYLAIPSVFDLAATALCMMGLRYLDASIYQLLRGSGIVFVALMKQNFLGDHLYKFQWWGVFWNVVSVALIGCTAILNSNDDAAKDTTEAIWGVILVLLGAFVQALQFVFEEKVMSLEESAAPPLLVIGMEGIWGSIICLFVLYPIAYFVPGDDHGSFEDPWNTWAMIKNDRNIQLAFVVYFIVIFGYNLFAVLVTYTLSSVWHSILDNFRPVTVWLVDLSIFYVFATGGDFGEPWTKWSFIQLFGMFVLLYGTAVYNAPNQGSIHLLGQWYALGINLKREYDQIEMERHDAELDAEWQSRKEDFKIRKPSSRVEKSPHISTHTQALRGFTSSKM